MKIKLKRNHKDIGLFEVNHEKKGLSGQGGTTKKAQRLGWQEA